MKEAIEKVVNAWWGHLLTLDVIYKDETGIDSLANNAEFKHQLVTKFPEYTFIYDGDKWLIVQEL